LIDIVFEFTGAGYKGVIPLKVQHAGIKERLFTASLCKRFTLRIYEITQFFLKWEYVFAALLEKRRQKLIEERSTTKILELR
jgi:hypothetical protein